MSYRDPHAMLECLFYVNELPGGEAHHDGGMKGRDHAAVLANPMLQLTADETGRARAPAAAADAHRRHDGAAGEGHAEPACCRRPTSPAIALPGTDKWVTRPRRLGSGLCRRREEVPARSASSCRAISNPSTKLGKAAALVPAGHRFEMSIQEQAATLMADGLSFVSRPAAAQRLRDVRGVHGRHRARRLRVLALPAQPQRLERRPERR